VRDVFATSPRDLRERASTTAAAGRGTVHLRLPLRLPWHPDNLFGHLAATAVPGVEEWRGGAYRRTLTLPHGAGIVSVRPAADHVACSLRLDDFRDLTAAIARTRRLLDLDADPAAVADALGADPALRPLITAAPGRRVPRTVDADELALRAVLGQQVSTAAAATHAGRLAADLGPAITDPDGGLTRRFPAPDAVAGVADGALRLPRSRASALRTLARALADGRIDLGPGADRDAARTALTDLPGIGAWTVEVIAMRGLGDPDAFLPTDLGVRAAADRLGLPATPAALIRHAVGWRPWRAYATQYLWATGDHPVNRLPVTDTAA
jgi:AraC family transcriptional regulator of adaptative response / DNA-3-methyladenine glycosylase II